MIRRLKRRAKYREARARAERRPTMHQREARRLFSERFTDRVIPAFMEALDNYWRSIDAGLHEILDKHRPGNPRYISETILPERPGEPRRFTLEGYSDGGIELTVDEAEFLPGRIILRGKLPE